MHAGQVLHLCSFARSLSRIKKREISSAGTASFSVLVFWFPASDFTGEPPESMQSKIGNCQMLEKTGGFAAGGNNLAPQFSPMTPASLLAFAFGIRAMPMFARTICFKTKAECMRFVGGGCLREIAE
jgi:hypothetical protein